MPNALWLDIETTGLTPAKDWVLEVGMIITTPGPEFAVLSTQNWVLPYRVDLNHSVVPVVYEMHTKNGLWDECRTAYNAEFPGTYESDMLEWMKENEAIGSVMHGATPSFDRSFLRLDFPGVEKAFHYRSFDVSTLKQFALFFDPEFLWMDREIHRAIPDLRDSIANAIHFRNVFKP